MQTLLQGERADHWLPGGRSGAWWGGVEWEGWITKQQLDTWERDGYVYPLDCNDGFVSIYMSMCIKLYNFTMCSLLYVDKTSVLKNGYETVEAAG